MMTGLEWFNNRPNRRNALVPNDISLDNKIGYAIFDPVQNGILDDAPPMPTDQPYVLLVAVYEDAVAYYWLRESALDDVDVDIWSEMRPSIFEQLGINNA